MWNDDNAIYDDGEWITWTEINSHLERLEFEAAFPHLDISLVPVFQTLLQTAQEYHELTGRHLQVYGDLGELYGMIVYGIKLHKIYAQGSDGRLENELVEIKTITPFKGKDIITLNMKRNFSAVLIVKIDRNFMISSRLIKRKDLRKTTGKQLRVSWASYCNDADQMHELLNPISNPG